jgi:hypothetical protein
MKKIDETAENETTEKIEILIKMNILYLIIQLKKMKTQVQRKALT